MNILIKHSAVDDILLTGNDHSCIAELKEVLDKKFGLKDLGSLRYFLGLEGECEDSRYQDQGTVLFNKRKVKSEMKKKNDSVLLIEKKKKLKETVSFHLNQEDTRHGLESLNTRLVC